MCGKTACRAWTSPMLLGGFAPSLHPVSHPTAEGTTMSTILIGVDESTRSEDAIAFGNRLADVSSANVVVACAFPFDDAIHDGSGGMFREALEDQAEKTVRAMRDRLDGVSADRLQIRTMPNPSAAHALHDLAQAEHAELIVVGSSHTGRMGRVAPGSTGERLLHGAPCAVAIVPDGYAARAERPIRRIGVAYDGSDEATAAIAAAVELARALSAELEIIGVVVPHPYAASGVMGGAVYVTPQDELDQYVQEDLDAAIAGLPEDVTAESVRLTGDPADQLGERSERLDLLLAGSRGYGPLRSVLVGGVSGRLMHTVRCPVIIVPRGVEAPLGMLFPSQAVAAP
jgi:nucleotide-binding universal stress UspA family protein